MKTVLTLKRESPSEAPYREELRDHLTTLLRNVVRDRNDRPLELDEEALYAGYVLLAFGSLLLQPTPPDEAADTVVLHLKAPDLAAYSRELAEAIYMAAQVLTQRQHDVFQPDLQRSLDALLLLAVRLPTTQVVQRQAVTA